MSNRFFTNMCTWTVAGMIMFMLLWVPVSGQKRIIPASKEPLQALAGLSDSSVRTAIDEAYAAFAEVKEGKNADYIKELANVNPAIYGIALVTAEGKIYTKGDSDSMVSIQSISKAFVTALVIEECGHQALQDKIGVDATGLKFNSIVAVEQNRGKELNSMVNPGAIAATSLVAGADSAAKWNNILTKLSGFAGRKLCINQPVYLSEAGDNLRNQAIAHLLKSYGRIYFDPVQSTDLYTRQCALNVSASDLAVMAATLANGGVNPVTGKMVVSPETVMYTLPVMATAGLYDDSGIWYYNSGIPAKSGVGGGMIAVVPGKFGIAVVSPPLDEAGNSVKGQKTIRYIVEKLGVNPFLVKPSH